MRNTTTPLVLLGILLLTATSGCFGGSDADDTDPSVEPPATTAQSRAVIGLQDNGINPYHVTFRDHGPDAWKHPSDYIPDYPVDAKPLEISLGIDDFWTAIDIDCETVWSNVEAGQLYYFPGTKIIGAITFEAFSTPDCNDPEPFIGGILSSSHGTMTASRSASIDYGACKACKIVMVEGFNTPGVAWLGDNHAWIDVQSHSWGPVTPVPTGPVDTGVLTADSDFVQVVEASAQQTMAFWASGNGAAFRLGVLGHPTQVSPHFTPSVVIVGGHDSGYINLWPGFTPHVISDSCDSWAAHHTSTNTSADNVGGGTSGATPYAAGNAAAILLEARTLLGDNETGNHDGIVARGDAGNITAGPLADGELTWNEWRDLVLKTASARPERQFEDGAVCSFGSGLFLYDSTPVRWNQVPEGYPEFIHIGYGAVDNVSKASAFSILRGEADLPDRTVTDAYFMADQQARQATYKVWAGQPL